MMKPLCIALFLILPLVNLFAQAQYDCSKGMKNDQLFKNEAELKDWLTRFDEDTLKMLNCLRERASDSIWVSKLPSSIYLIKNLSLRTSDSRIKDAAIKLFIATSKTNNSNASLLSVNALKSFNASDFDDPGIDSIMQLMVNCPNIYKETVELAGYIGNPRLLSKIKEIFPSSRSYSKPEKWASYKALARLGDKEALDFCIKRVTSLPLNDQVVDVLYPDLIYIHQKEAFDVLIKALNSDELLCSSSNPNSDSKILCGYRIMELLAPQIENFPVKVLPSGDLDSKDYRKTLKEVRVWFAKNASSYSIIKKY